MSGPDRPTLFDEVASLRARLAEAEQALEAIRAGEVDSILVDGPGGVRVFALDSGSNSYRVLVEAMNEGAAMLTPEGVLLYSNGRLAAMLARPLERVMGATLQAFVAPPFRDVVEAMLRAAAEGDSRGEVTLVDGDGEEIPVMLSMSTIDHEGQSTVCLVATDLRAQKRSEELVAAQEAMREMDRRKNEFLGVLSHELRNPLTPIRNSMYILDRTPPDSAQSRRAREIIKRQVDHLARLVNELLDVTRISHGKVALESERVDLRDVVRQACDDLASTFVERAVELHVELPAAAVWLKADAVRLAQVTGNLLQNAIKFTPRGGRVQVEVREFGDRAELSVRDTGIGLDPRDVDRMFEPFVQADRSLARTSGGLGLGLALVKAVAELHGGTVSAHSEGFGRGAEFRVSLPLHAPQTTR